MFWINLAEQVIGWLQATAALWNDLPGESQGLLLMLACALCLYQSGRTERAHVVLLACAACLFAIAAAAFYTALLAGPAI